jgi:formate dehydrogenase subunit delta
MSLDHDEQNPAASGIAKIVRMANQIGTFFMSKPHEMGVEGVAEHINKFWEPRMRGHFFEVFDAGGEGMLPIVMEAAPKIRRPGAPVTSAQAEQANAGVPGDKGEDFGETKSRIAASQG